MRDELSARQVREGSEVGKDQRVANRHTLPIDVYKFKFVVIYGCITCESILATKFQLYLCLSSLMTVVLLEKQTDSQRIRISLPC